MTPEDSLTTVTGETQLRHDSFSSTSDSMVTSDDRAELLHSYLSADHSAADDDETAKYRSGCEFNAEAKSSVVDQKHQVYTITDDSLPSHMRSLLPSHEQHVHELLTLEHTRRRLRHVIIGLSLLLTLALLVALTLVFSLKVKEVDMTTLQRGPPRGHSVNKMTEVDREVKLSVLHSGQRDDLSPKRWPAYIKTGADDQRTPCLRECWAYAAFRFRSECYQGYCRCNADDYDPYTCLPEYKSCAIRRESSNGSSASYKGQGQTAYVCRAPPSIHGNVHVISLFGNHRSPSTLVSVQGRRGPADRTLVLVSYHYVKWILRLPRASGLSRVFVVSMKTQPSRDGVEFQWIAGQDQRWPQVAGDSSAQPDVEVQYRNALTGYGEDQNGGHTPRLLRYVEDVIGPVTSFLGAAHADAIALDLDDVEPDDASVTSENNTATATSASYGESETSLLNLLN